MTLFERFTNLYDRKTRTPGLQSPPWKPTPGCTTCDQYRTRNAGSLLSVNCGPSRNTLRPPRHGRQSRSRARSRPADRDALPETKGDEAQRAN